MGSEFFPDACLLHMFQQLLQHNTSVTTATLVLQHNTHPLDQEICSSTKAAILPHHHQQHLQEEAQDIEVVHSASLRVLFQLLQEHLHPLLSWHGLGTGGSIETNVPTQVGCTACLRVQLLMEPLSQTHATWVQV